MGFVLAVFYFVVTYLGTGTIFGSFAAYHIELILAVVILLVSLPALLRSFIFKTPQSLALIGLALAVFLSMLIGAHWAGGAVKAVLDFVPSIYAYFLVCLHCSTRGRLKILISMLLFVCMFVIVHGIIDLRHGVSLIDPRHPEVTSSPYILAQTNDAREQIYRLKGQNFLNDPNDFAQFIVCVIPLAFFFWRSKKTVRNLVLVLMPVGLLLYGVFLTHSRGAVVALMAVLVVALRRRIGTLPSLLGAGAMFLAAMALNFTGGRSISAGSGSDRTALWGEGLQLLKSHPLFGVGFNQMADQVGMTAHNSVVVCAAELGLTGLFFWSMFLFPSLRDAIAVASPEKVREGTPFESKDQHDSLKPVETDPIDKAEINRMGRLMILSFTGFLVAGWFLSRAYIMTFFLLGGMAEVVFEMALQRGTIASRLPLARVLLYAGILTISLIVLVYILIRVLNLVH